MHSKEKYGNCDVAVRKGFEQYKQLANWAGLMRVRRPPTLFHLGGYNIALDLNDRRRSLISAQIQSEADGHQGGKDDRYVSYFFPNVSPSSFDSNFELFPFFVKASPMSR